MGVNYAAQTDFGWLSITKIQDSAKIKKLKRFQIKNR
jgi:hypothetical protein